MSGEPAQVDIPVEPTDAPNDAGVVTDPVVVSADFENLKPFDPFAEADEELGEEKVTRNFIHIRIQQRNGRKTLTTVQGLSTKYDLRKILSFIKKKFACNGTTVFDTKEGLGQIIQLQGDQRKLMREFLIDNDEGLGIDPRDIKVHGF